MVLRHFCAFFKGIKMVYISVNQLFVLCLWCNHHQKFSLGEHLKRRPFSDYLHSLLLLAVVWYYGNQQSHF